MFFIFVDLVEFWLGQGDDVLLVLSEYRTVILLPRLGPLRDEERVQPELTQSLLGSYHGYQGSRGKLPS